MIRRIKFWPHQFAGLSRQLKPHGHFNSGLDGHQSNAGRLEFPILHRIFAGLNGIAIAV